MGGRGYPYPVDDEGGGGGREVERAHPLREEGKRGEEVGPVAGKVIGWKGGDARERGRAGGNGEEVG